MKLHDNQLKLIYHLARFNLLDYTSCLEMLKTQEMTDRVELSYAFRPLTKNGYVSILAKGRGVYPDTKPLITTGGGARAMQRVAEVSRMAMLMEECDVPVVEKPLEGEKLCFVPSACWRNVAPGILSTTRFTGMLLEGKQKLAVYNIGDGCMEWQVRAEGSLFYTKYGRYETKATGMILICERDKRNEIARNIIRQTMWNRRQLLSDSCLERNRPTRWSNSPIKLRTQYEHVYLTTWGDFNIDLQAILGAEEQVRRQRECYTNTHDPAQGDYEKWPYRFFANPATDLLKYVYFFAAGKGLLKLLTDDMLSPPEVRYAICYRHKDIPILRMYPDVIKLEGMRFFEYQSE